MLDAIIILSFIIAGAGIGFYSLELLPISVQQQVTNEDALRSIVGVFGAVIGGAVGLSFQITYRRLETKVR